MSEEIKNEFSFDNEQYRTLLGGLEGAGVGHQVGQLQGRQTVLPFAEKVAGAPVFQVVAGDGEAVGGVAQKLQPLTHRFALVVADQNTPALAAAPAHPAPQLVQSR